MISHEFRTPLATMIITVQNLRGRKGALPFQPELAAIDASSQTLLAFFNNALDYARYTTARLDPTLAPANIRTLVRSVLDMLSPRIQAKAIEVSVEYCSEFPDLIISDEHILRQLITNLIDNAVKYTQEGQVKISAQVIRGRLRIEVQDTGPGVPPEERTAIFHLFQRGASTASAEGVGLGLALCKRLTQALGGEIGVESERGQGATFWFEVPVELVEAHDSDDSDDRQVAYSILLVEDHAFNRLMLKEQFEQNGFELTDVGSIDAAFGLLQAGPASYDIILTDYFVGDKTGADLARQVRSNGLDIPIIVLTASLDMIPPDLARAAGIDGVLTKPLSLPLFLRAARNALAQRNLPKSA